MTENLQPAQPSEAANQPLPQAAPAPTQNPAPTQPAAPQAAPQQVYAAPQQQIPASPATPAARPAAPSPLGQQNVYSVLAVILAFFFPIMGIVFGHMGLSQIKKTREPGRGLAITGLTVGYVFTVLGIIAFFIWCAAIAALSYGMGYSGHEMLHDLESF